MHRHDILGCVKDGARCIFFDLKKRKQRDSGETFFQHGFPRRAARLKCFPDKDWRYGYGTSAWRDH